MKLTLRQKKTLLRLSEPGLRLLYFCYRVAARDLGRSRQLPEHPERILVVRLDTIGDVLLSEPAIAALRGRFPQARIDVATGRGGRAVLLGNPAIDRFVVYDAPWHAAWRGQRIDWRVELGRLWGVVRPLRRERYDLALELRSDARDIGFMAATGARVKVGNSWRGGGFMLNYDVPLDLNAHRVDWALGLAAAAGAPALPRPPRVHPSPEACVRAQELLPGADEQAYVGMHLGAGFASKRLPVDTFAEVARGLRERHGARLVVVGGSEDRPLAEDLQGRLPFAVVNLVGRVSVLETAAVLGRCRLFVGNDSAPMHLAAAVDTPVVTFFGPSEPEKYHPYGPAYRLLVADVPCRPCDHIHCVTEDYRCMRRFRAEEILESCEELWCNRQKTALLPS